MIIGVCGLAGSGKTTLARMLEAEFGFARISFAGPLKAMTRALGLSPREMAGDLKEAPCAMLCGKTPRQFMQLLGTEFGRQMIGQDFWVEAWKRAAAEAANDQIAAACVVMPARIVADDVRFANEAAAIRSLGGRVVRIDRPGAGSASGAAHASERIDFDVDGVFSNTESEAKFLAQIRDQVGMALRLSAA